MDDEREEVAVEEEQKITLVDKIRAHVQEKKTKDEQLEEAYRIIAEQVAMLNNVQNTLMGNQMMAAHAFIAGLRATDHFWNGSNPETFGIELNDDLEIGTLWNGTHIRLDKWKPCNMFKEWQANFYERLAQKNSGLE